MKYQIIAAALFAQAVLAVPQMPTKGTGAPKGTSSPKGTTSKGTTPKGKGGAGGLGGLLSLLGGGSSGPGGLAGIAASFGLDPNSEVSDMVCQTFNGNSTLGNMLGSIFGSPIGKEPGEECVKDTSGGSGPYKAAYFGEPSLENHTIYAPKTPPPPGVKLPVIVWSNGFCMSAGTMFANFLNEIASHGFFIVSNGAAKGGLGGGMTTYKELIKAMDWVTTNPAVKKYGDIDIHNIAVSGQSCGGMEAYQASPDPRVNLTVLFNSGNFAGSTPGAMAKQTKPVAWFLGGPNDMAQKNGDADYKNLGAVPALKGSIDVGHIGTYYQKGGGKIGRAAVAYFSWKQKGETKYKAEFCGTGGELTKVGWKFEAKNGMC